MGKLQNISLITAVSILSLSNIKTLQANSSPIFSQPDKIEIAQKSEASEDEMLDALQERQEKLEKLEVIKNLEKNHQILKSLEKEEFNIQSIEELAAVKEIVNNNSLDDNQVLEILQEKQLDIQNVEELEEFKAIINGNNSDDASFKMSQPMAFKMLTIGLPASLLIILICFPIIKALTGEVAKNVEETIGNPPVPEGAIALYNKAFKEISAIGKKAEIINNDKFGNKEFKELIMFKVNVSKKTDGYLELKNSVELLKAAIAAQKSFLKLESTELRYRSRKQQEFYQYVADNLAEDVDKEAFAKKVKKKQAEIIPLINSEEGREAISSYVKELNILSQHELGLKLLSLFKQYDLQDFSILKRVSDVIQIFKPKNYYPLKV